MALRIFHLVHEEARRRCADFSHKAPDGVVVTFKEPNRTSGQNAKFHAMCSDLANSDVQWAGKRRTADEWKVLLVSGHAVATKEGAEIIPGIEGEFVNVRESTATMTKARGASLIEYASAFLAAHGLT